MKFTLSWLKRHLDTSASLEEISETLTAIGLEVEEIIDNAEKYAPFTVAYVEAAEKHPDADKLQVCTVKTKDGTHQIVCGAPNARAGMKGVFAPEGTYIPGLDVTLKKAKIRGVESCGMLVSEKEMELSDEHKGIIEVDESFEIGTPLAEVFGLDDPVIDIALTPNRADCAGVYGIARDLAAAGLGSLKPLSIEAVDGDFKSSVDVAIEDDGCKQFLGRQIKGVKNTTSPEWLQNLLKAVGLRPISALVDITNFVNLDHARPLHVYDVQKLSGNIAVRATAGGEEFEALNDKSYTSNEGSIGIYDDSGLIGLGGIVGGVTTGCTEETTDVFLEAAYFEPTRIARAGRDLGVTSDARYRFERGVDPAFTREGFELATQLILEFCGGEASEVVEVGGAPKFEREIEYDPAYLEQLIGLNVSADKQQQILHDLGFHVDCDSHHFNIHVPSWRGDVEGRADIAEEVIRIVGFDDIPNVSVTSEAATPAPAETPLLAKTRAARAALAARGLQECVTWSFLSRAEAVAFGANDNQIAALTLQNAISSEMDVMRPSILPNLIAAAGRNAARGYADVSLCEVGPVFESPKPDGQAILAAGIRSGSFADRNWAASDAARPVDLYDAKADALAALEACGAPESVLGINAQITRDASDYFHPGRSGAIRLGKNVLAQFGEIHPSVLEELDVKGPVVGFEIFLENIPESKKKGTEKPFLDLPPLQPLTKDFAFLVDESVASRDIIKSAMAADKKLITDAAVFDVYQGKGVEDGKKSVALSVTIQPIDETLNDEQIDALMKSVIDLVEQKTGGVLRG